MKDNQLKAIGVLNSNGYDVLAVKLTPDEYNFFITDKFSKSFNSSVESVEYHSFKGIDVTELLSNNSLTQHMQGGFLANYNNLVSKCIAFDIEISKDTPWIYFQQI